MYWGIVGYTLSSMDDVQWHRRQKIRGQIRAPGFESRGLDDPFGQIANLKLPIRIGFKYHGQDSLRCISMPIKQRQPEASIEIKQLANELDHVWLNGGRFTAGAHIKTIDLIEAAHVSAHVKHILPAKSGAFLIGPSWPLWISIGGSFCPDVLFDYTNGFSIAPLCPCNENNTNLVYYNTHFAAWKAAGFKGSFYERVLA